MSKYIDPSFWIFTRALPAVLLTIYIVSLSSYFLDLTGIVDFLCVGFDFGIIKNSCVHSNNKSFYVLSICLAILLLPVYLVLLSLFTWNLSYQPVFSFILLKGSFRTITLPYINFNLFILLLIVGPWFLTDLSEGRRTMASYNNHLIFYVRFIVFPYVYISHYYFIKVHKE